MDLEPYHSISLNALLARLGHRDQHEWQLLASNFYGGWGAENFEFTLLEAEAPFESDLELARQAVAGHEAYLEPERREQNRETVALHDWQYDGNKLRANFVASDYFRHRAYGEMVRVDGKIPLGVSALALNMLAVTADGFVLLQKTSAGSYSGTLTEWVSMGDVARDQIDVIGGAQRSVREQLGLGVTRDALVFTGLGVNRQDGHCALMGLCYLKQTWIELWLGDERWEQEGFGAVKFEVELVLNELTAGSWDYASQLGLLEALIYKYGVDSVFEAAGAQKVVT
jgi:hypothetical protein